MNKIVLLTAIILFCGCKSQVKKDQSQIKIIPKPLELSAVQGMYELNSSTRIYFDQEASDLTGVGNQFINELEEATGIEIRPRSNASKEWNYCSKE